MKRQLEQAIRSAGSVKAVAAEIGLSPSTIRRWRRKGVPKRGDGRAKLIAYKERRKVERARISSELKTLKRLRKLAVEGKLEPGQPPVKFSPVRTYEKKMDGRLAAGYQWVKAFNRELNLAAVDDVEKWARTHRKRFPLWFMRFRMVQFSREEKFAFPKSDRTIEVMVADPERNQFMAEMLMPTPRNKSLAAVLNYSRAQLEGMIETGGTIFLLTAELYNYRLRTDAERRKRETAYRRRSAWKKSKRTKKSKPKAKAKSPWKKTTGGKRSR